MDTRYHDYFQPCLPTVQLIVSSLEAGGWREGTAGKLFLSSLIFDETTDFVSLPTNSPTP